MEELAEALQDKFRQAGAGALGLLQWLKCLRSDLRYGTQVELLAEVLGQRFALKDNRPEPLEQSEGSAVQSPHDPDAQYAAKGRGKPHKAWLGYKAQVAETLPDANWPALVVSIVTQKATQGDEPGLGSNAGGAGPKRLATAPGTLADGGYIFGPQLHRAAQEGWSLMGPACRPAKSTALSSWASTMNSCSNVAKNKVAKPSVQQMHQRNAVEGTLSELARGHGMRRSRYRGFGKVELQNLFIGTACNVKRWLRFLIREAKHAQTQAFRLKLTVPSLQEGVLTQSLWQSVSCWRALPLVSVST